MHSKNLWTLFFSIFACVFPASVLANDTLATLGAGGLVPTKSSEISMEFEDLRISTRQISIKYIFRNISSHDIDATIAFPFPALDGGDVYHEPMNLPNEDTLNFVNFKVSENGNDIPVKTEVRAYQKNRDVTRHLRSLGLQPMVLPKPLNANLAKLSDNQKSQLEKEEFIIPEDRDWWANWSMHVQFYWNQHFPAGKTIELVQTYSPVVGGSYIPSNSDGTSSIKPYCGDEKALMRIKNVQTKNPTKDPLLYERTIQYILTTAKNWKGPIKDFRLSIDADDSNDIVLTCFNDINETSPAHYEVHLSDFKPDQDLNLLILQETLPIK